MNSTPPIAMSGRMQHNVNADGIIWKDNQTVVGFLQDAGVQQCTHVAMHALNVAIDASRSLSDCERSSPVIIRINSQRFAVMSRKSSSGVAKLIRAPCFLPLNASRARRLTSLSVATFSVTVFISESPSSDPIKRREERSPAQSVGAAIGPQFPSRNASAD